MLVLTRFSSVLAAYTEEQFLESHCHYPMALTRWFLKNRVHQIALISPSLWVSSTRWITHLMSKEESLAVQLHTTSPFWTTASAASMACICTGAVAFDTSKKHTAQSSVKIKFFCNHSSDACFLSSLSVKRIFSKVLQNVWNSGEQKAPGNIFIKLTKSRSSLCSYRDVVVFSEEKL